MPKSYKKEMKEVIDPESGEKFLIEADYSLQSEIEKAKIVELTYRRKVKNYLNDIVKWRASGKGVKNIVQMLDINESQWYAIKNKYPDVLEAWEAGNEMLGENVETALYNEALGYKYEEQMVSNKGNVLTVQKYARPQVSAQKFALTNTKPKKWKNKVEQKQQPKLSGIDIEALRSLSVDDLKKLIASKSEKEDKDE